MWEHSSDAEPVEFLDDRSIVKVLAEPRAPYDVTESSDEKATDIQEAPKQHGTGN
jgi:hypothetical protein